MKATLTQLAQEHITGYGDDSQAAKMKYHHLAKIALRKLARDLGLTNAEYDLRSNKGGIAVCGEVTLHTDKIYVQVSQSCLGPGHEIMFRTCKGRRDYTGGMNNFAPASALEDGYDRFLARVKDLAGKTVIH